MPTRLILLMLFIGVFHAAHAQDTNPAEILAGPVEEIILDSRILGQDREVLVALPHDYGSSNERYPVLYVLDSEWHLLPAIAAVRMLAETSYIQAHRIPKMIVVGVRGIDRNHDHTPSLCVSQHGMSFPTSGGADAFLDFFDKELIPEIDSRYRSQPYRVLAGWSLGGLLTMHALFDRPEIFGGHLAISPSLWWDERALLDRAQELVADGRSRERDLIITVGTAEEGGLCYEAIHELARRWELAPLDDLRWELLELEGEDHNHGPYDAYFEGLRALYAEWFYPEAAFEEGLQAMESHYAALSERWGYPVAIPDHIYNALSRTYLSEGRIDEAVAVAELRCRQDPESPITRYLLGEVYREADRGTEARDAYTMALELELGTAEPDTVFTNWLQQRLEGLEEAPYSFWPELHGPYLGQQPPGTTVEVFAPDFLTPPERFHSSILFSADGREAYWTEQGGTSWVSRYVDDVWLRPVALPFDEEYGVREPFLTDGDRLLYYLSRRPLDDDPVERERIWSVMRTEDGWSEPTVIDAVVRAHPTHWQFSSDTEGELYFTSEIRSEGGEGDIFVARRMGDGFSEPQGVGSAINTNAREFCPYVAPDGRYLIFARTRPGERADLYVSFRGDDGEWLSAVPLGSDINSEHNEVSPMVTPDGRYLFFLRMSADYCAVHWVDSERLTAPTLPSNSARGGRQSHPDSR